MYRLYEAFENGFLKYYYLKLSRRLTHQHLNPVFVDDQGRTYYEYPDNLNLPLFRYGKQKEFYEWLSAGINSENLGQLLDVAKDMHFDSLKSFHEEKAFRKSMVKLLKILEEIDNRRNQIIPIDIMVNVLATQLCREDEDPSGWSDVIHAEKCDFIMAHINDYGFFFQVAAFRRLLKLLNISKDGYKQLLTAWVADQKELRAVLEIISQK